MKLTDGEAAWTPKDNPHPPLKHYETEGVLKAPLNEYFLFTFTRNPWARQVSGYYWQDWPRKEGLTFAEYCRRKTMMYQYNCLRYHTPSPIHFDFVGRMENIQTDFDALCDKLGLQRMTIPHVNTTEHGDYREYYDDESREIIAEKYARDIEIFGYTFDD